MATAGQACAESAAACAFSRDRGRRCAAPVAAILANRLPPSRRPTVPRVRAASLRRVVSCRSRRRGRSGTREPVPTGPRRPARAPAARTGIDRADRRRSGRGRRPAAASDREEALRPAAAGGRRCSTVRSAGNSISLEATRTGAAPRSRLSAARRDRPPSAPYGRPQASVPSRPPGSSAGRRSDAAPTRARTAGAALATAASAASPAALVSGNEGGTGSGATATTGGGRFSATTAVDSPHHAAVAVNTATTIRTRSRRRDADASCRASPRTSARSRAPRRAKALRIRFSTRAGSCTGSSMRNCAPQPAQNRVVVRLSRPQSWHLITPCSRLPRPGGRPML